MDINTYVPKYIKQTEDKRPRSLVTADRWNELWNLSTIQGDYTSEVVGSVITYLLLVEQDADNDVATINATLLTHLQMLQDRYTKAESDSIVTSNTNDLVKNVTFNSANGTFSFIKKDNTVVTIDTNLEKVPATFTLIEIAGIYYLKVTNMDGSTSQMDMTNLMDVYNFSNTATIAFTKSGTGNVKTMTADVRDASITLAKLNAEVVSALAGYRDAAQIAATTATSQADIATTKAASAATSEANALASKNAAALSASNARTSELNAASSATNANTSAGTATTKANEALASSNTAFTKASEAMTSATNAKTSETNAKASETSATTSANTATSKAAAALVSETNAKASEVNVFSKISDAAASATLAKNSETNAKTSETSAAGSAATATTKATEANASAVEAKAQADRAVAIVNIDYATQEEAEAGVNNTKIMSSLRVLQSVQKNAPSTLARFADGTGTTAFALSNGSTRPATLGIQAVDLSYTLTSGGAAGLRSFAAGYETYASGTNSFASGQLAKATGNTSHAEGHTTTASGAASHAEGQNTTASATDAHAEGNTTQATGLFSHSEGIRSIASGTVSHAEGGDTVASGVGSHSQNSGTIAQGFAQTAIGLYNIASGTVDAKVDTDFAFIIGNGADAANRKNAFTVDWKGNVTIPEDASFKLGEYSLVDLIFTHTGNDSIHKQGYEVVQTGGQANATGSATKALGYCSTASGFHTEASGETANASGSVTVAAGHYSNAMGQNTIAQGYAQTVLGSYNAANGTFDSKIATDKAFIIGNGTVSVRSNAFSVDWSGNIDIPATADLRIGGVGIATQISIKSTVDPTITDTAYAIGRMWTNTTTGETFIRVNTSEVWVKVTTKSVKYEVNMVKFNSMPNVSNIRLKVEKPLDSDGVMIRYKTTAWTTGDTKDSGVLVANITDDTSYKGVNQWYEGLTGLTAGTLYYFKAFPYKNSSYNEAIGANETKCKAGGLYLEYTFDSISGTTVTDTSGNGKNGTSANLTVSGGLVGNEGVGNGTNTSVLIGDYAQENKTMCAFVTPMGNGSIVSFEGASSYYNNFDYASGVLTVSPRGYTNKKTYAVTANTRAFICTKNTGTSGKARLNAEAFVAVTGDNTKSASGTGRIFSNSTTGGAAISYCASKVDQFRIFNRELEDYEVDNIYNGGLGC